MSLIHEAQSKFLHLDPLPSKKSSMTFLSEQDEAKDCNAVGCGGKVALKGATIPLRT